MESAQQGKESTQQGKESHRQGKESAQQGMESHLWLQPGDVSHERQENWESTFRWLQNSQSH